MYHSTQASTEGKNFSFFSRTSNHFSILPLVWGWLTFPRIYLMWFLRRYPTNSVSPFSLFFASTA